MGKIKEIFQSLKNVFIEPDTVENYEYEDAVTEIGKIDAPEDVKSELKKSLELIDKEYIFDNSKKKVEQEIDKKDKNLKVKVNSMTAVAEANKKINKDVCRTADLKL